MPQYLATFFQYSVDCSSLELHFANCTSFWGILYFLLAICLIIGFKKLTVLIYTTGLSSPKPANAKSADIAHQQKSKPLEQWPDSAFAEFSHERILHKFHKELNE